MLKIKIEILNKIVKNHYPVANIDKKHGGNKMKDDVKIKILEDDKTPLAVLISDEWRKEDSQLVGFVPKKKQILFEPPYESIRARIIQETIQPPIWAPYRVDPQGKMGFDFKAKSSYDFYLSPSACLGPIGTIEQLIDEVSSGKEMHLSLVDGEFPRGCGLTTYSPRLIITPDKIDVKKTLRDLMGYDPGAKLRTEGKIRLEKSGLEGALRVYDLSSEYTEKIGDYIDILFALSTSYIAKEGTPILCHATMDGKRPDYFKK